MAACGLLICHPDHCMNPRNKNKKKVVCLTCACAGMRVMLRVSACMRVVVGHECVGVRRDTSSQKSVPYNSYYTKAREDF